MSILWMNYIGRLWPGLAAGLGLVAILGKKSRPEARLMVYILLFVVMRDALAPASLWHIGTMPVIWMRFARDWMSLFLLGAFSLGIVYALQRFEPELAKTVVWRRKPWVRSAGLGLAAGIVIGAPAVAMACFVPPWGRGGNVAASFWPVIAWVAFAGNLLEEILFRGYLQPIFERKLGIPRSVWASGIAFAAVHGDLAAHLGGTATFILVAFSFYEGVICAWVRRRDGVVASTIAHGLGIFLISIGIP